MEIICSIRRRILDHIDGQPNVFKPIILDVEGFSSYKRLPMSDPAYLRFEMSEKDWSEYMQITNRNYWEWIFNIAQACTTSQYPKAELKNAYCAMKADDAILNATVPAGLPMRSYQDENEQEVVHTFGSWYPDGIKPRHNNKVVLLTMPHGDFLTDQQLLALKQFADNDPTLNIEFLHNAATQEELKNG